MVGATTLTISRDSDYIRLKAEALARLREKHGDAIETYWRNKFGYCLTEPEASYLLRTPDVERIRTRIARAEERGGQRLFAEVPGATE